MAMLPWEEEQRCRYQAGGIGGRLEPGKRPAVLVVDLSRGFTDAACPAGADLSDVVAATRTVLDVAREQRHPCVFTTVAFASGRAVGALWLRKMPVLGGLVEGSPWAEIDERLGRRADEPVVSKQAASAFAGTDLDRLLASLHVDTVVLCGASTSGCVRATATDLCQLGYPTFVPVECVGDRAAGPHRANLFDIDAKYADVVTLDECIALLRRVRPRDRASAAARA